jgi:nicotinamidase-related amidase
MTTPFPLQTVPASQLIAMIEPARTALLVVDVQNDFASPSGAMGRAGLNLACVDPAVDRIESLIHAARKAGVSIVFLRVLTRPESDSTALKLLWQRKGRPGGEAICRADHSGSDYYRIAPVEGDLEVGKTLFSGFHGTTLDELLRRQGIENLIVCGLTTDCCVDSTVRDGFHRNYNCFVVIDACASYDENLHMAMLAGLSKNCALLSTASEIRAAFSGR